MWFPLLIYSFALYLLSNLNLLFTSQPIFYLKRCARFTFLSVTVSFTGLWVAIIIYMSFPGSSAPKESTCNPGDQDSIPGSGRSPGEGIGYPFQYSWSSLVVQTVKNLPAMQETWLQSLGWEDPLDMGMATHSSILAWRIPCAEKPGELQVHGVTKSQM